MSKAYELLDTIMGVLLGPDNRRMDSIVTKLVAQNSEIRGDSSFGFMHHGKRFIDPRFKSQERVLAKYPMPTLSLQLMDDLRQFDKDRKRLELDSSRIRQALLPLLINCNDQQEVRDALPECIVSLLPELAKLPRKMRNPATLIRDDKFAMAAFEKALPLMEAYSVSALLF